MVLAIVNQKGGTGKTTTAINLAGGLASEGKKVLLLGMDIQGDLSYALNIEEKEKTISEVLLGELNINDVILQSEGYDVIPGNVELADVELTLLEQRNKEFFLKTKLQELKTTYDYVIIDCSPSLSLLTVNALVAAEKILIPMQLTVLGVNALEQMLSTIKKIKKVLNEKLEVLGVLTVMVDKRKKLSKEIYDYLKENFDIPVFETAISTNVRLAEAPSFGVSIFKYAPQSKGAIEYKALTKEILKIK